MNLIYIVIVIFVLALLSLFLIKNIFVKTKKTKKISNNTKKKIEKLKAELAANPKDYVSMYQLALLEDEAGEIENAIKKYEELLNVSFFQGNEEFEVYKKIERYYNDINNKEMSFKYALKIGKIDVNNTYYAIKVATILGQEGYYLLACDYFNKALLSKNEFDIESIKTAIFSYFKVKEYNKCVVFLEELYRRFGKNSSEELSNLLKSLISMYLLSDELNIARGFVEQIMIEKIYNHNNMYYIDRMYLFILYKLADNDKFREFYDKFYIKYNLKEYNMNRYILIFDYCFYSYFLKDTEFSISSFRAINNFNLDELKIYNIDNILKYLTEINNATSRLNKLRNAMGLENSKNDNYEKYVDKDVIENWEKDIDLWEGSFVDLDYITSLINVEKTIDIEKILNELKIDTEHSNNEMNLKIVKKVDKIYNLNKIDFKKLCQNVIRSRLAYSIVQEYTDTSTSSDYGDEINYLTYHVKGNKKDLTLISFKRWKKVEIGELMIRDFLMMVNESGAKNGILIVPVKLTSSAKSYASHSDKITVYSRNQFNNLLKDENI